MITSPIFDTETTTASQAIAQAAARWHGIVPNEKQWEVIAVYDVKPDTSATLKENGQPARVALAQFDRVFVMENTAERNMRKQLKISDECLDPFTTSWYLTPTRKNT